MVTLRSYILKTKSQKEWQVYSMKLDIQLFGGRGSESMSGAHSKGDLLKGDYGKPSPPVDVSRIPNIQSMSKFEDYIKMKDEPVEYGFYVDENGKVIAGAKGDKHSVAVGIDADKETSKLTFTHNHPNRYGGTFSSADVSSLTTQNLKEMRAVAKEGTYSLKRMRGAKPLDFNRALNKAIPKIESQARSNAGKVKSAGLSQTEYRKKYRKAYVDTYSSWYKKNASKYGYKYEFKPNKGYK